MAKGAEIKVSLWEIHAGFRIPVNDSKGTCLVEISVEEFAFDSNVVSFTRMIRELGEGCNIRANIRSCGNEGIDESTNALPVIETTNILKFYG